MTWEVKTSASKSSPKQLKEFGQIDILINNAAEQHVQTSIETISAAQLEQTFRTNIFSYLFSKAALPHAKNGSTIINATSVTAYAGNEQLIDYSATKGAIVAFTRSAIPLSLHKVSVSMP